MCAEQRIDGDGDELAAVVGGCLGFFVLHLAHQVVVAQAAARHRQPVEDEPENAQDALLRGAWHVLGLLMPYLGGAARTQMLALIDAYRPADPT